MKICKPFLLHMTNSEQIIKNINLPSCRNCVYYKPDSLEFTSYGKCEKFGIKNIVTNKISYSFAESNRYDENMCGKDGKYFEEEKNINLKILKHKLKNNFYYIIPILVLIINLYFLNK